MDRNRGAVTHKQSTKIRRIHEARWERESHLMKSRQKEHPIKNT